jgi:hypothetical protein
MNKRGKPMEKEFYQVNGQFYYQKLEPAIKKAKDILWEDCQTSAGKLPYTQNWTYEKIEVLESPAGNFSVLLRDSQNGKCLTKRLVRKLFFEKN